MGSGRETITVLARHYTPDEEFWLGYQCKKCGLRFGSIQEMQKHSLIHQTIVLEICEKCGKLRQLVTHHIDYEENITERLCAECHGRWHSKFTPNWGTKDLNIPAQTIAYFQKK